jgi:hypothetical protein
MKRTLNLIIMVGIMDITSGCASFLSYQASQKEIIGQRVQASGDEAAIKAFRSGQTVGLGVNVLATEALTAHPFRQLMAAILDLGAVYGISEAIGSLDSGGGGSHGGSRNLNIDNTGDANTFNINTGDNSDSNADDNTNNHGDSNQDQESSTAQEE